MPDISRFEMGVVNQAAPTMSQLVTESSSEQRAVEDVKSFAQLAHEADGVRQELENLTGEDLKQQAKALFETEMEQSPKLREQILALPVEERQKVLQQRMASLRQTLKTKADTSEMGAISGIESGAHFLAEDQASTINDPEGVTPWKWRQDSALRHVAAKVGGKRGLELYKLSMRMHPEVGDLPVKVREIAKSELVLEYGDQIRNMGVEERQRLLKEKTNTLLSTWATGEEDTGGMNAEERGLFEHYRRDQYGAPRDWREGGTLGTAMKVLTTPSQMTTGAASAIPEVLAEKTAEAVEAGEIPAMQEDTSTWALPFTKVQKVAGIAGDWLKDSVGGEDVPEDAWKSPKLYALGRTAESIPKGYVETLATELQLLGGRRVMGVDPKVAAEKLLNPLDPTRFEILGKAIGNAVKQFSGNETDAGSGFQALLAIRKTMARTAMVEAKNRGVELTKENLSAIHREIVQRDAGSMALDNPLGAQFVGSLVLDPWAAFPLGKVGGPVGKYIKKGWHKVPEGTRKTLHEAFSTAHFKQDELAKEAKALGVDVEQLTADLFVADVTAMKRGERAAAALAPTKALQASSPEVAEHATKYREGFEKLTDIPEAMRDEVITLAREGEKAAIRGQAVRESTPSVGAQYSDKGVLETAAERQLDDYVPRPAGALKPGVDEVADVGVVGDDAFKPTGTKNLTPGSERARKKITSDSYKQDMFVRWEKASQKLGRDIELNERVRNNLQVYMKHGLLKPARLDDLALVKYGEDPGALAEIYGKSVGHYRAKAMRATLSKMKEETGIAWFAIRQPKKLANGKRPTNTVFEQSAKLSGTTQLSNDMVFFVPKFGVRGHLDDIGKLVTKPQNEILKMFDKGLTASGYRALMNTWRTSVTVLRGLPYMMRNATTAAVIPSLAAGLKGVEPATARSALQATLTSIGLGGKAKGAIKLADGSEMALSKAVKLLDDAGFIDTHFARMGLEGGGKSANIARTVAEHVLPTGIPVPVAGKLKKLSAANLNRGVENYQKIATFLSVLEGSSKAQINKALKLTQKYGGHYKNLTTFERSVMREVIPFYAWTKFIWPTSVKALGKRPEVFANFVKARKYFDKENANKYSQYTRAAIPAWARAFGVISPGSDQPKLPDDDNRFAVSMWEDPWSMGFAWIPALEQAITGKEVPGGDAIRSMLGLGPVAAYEFISGRDWKTDQPHKDMKDSDIIKTFLGGVDGIGAEDIERAINLLKKNHPLLKNLVAPLEPMSRSMLEIGKIWEDLDKPEAEWDLRLRYAVARRMPLIASVINFLREGEDYSQGTAGAWSTFLAQAPEVTLQKDTSRKVGAAGRYGETLSREKTKP